MQQISQYMAEQYAQKNKKNSMRTTIIVHIILLILAIIPFLSMTPDPEWQTIMVTFEEPPKDFSSGSSQAGLQSSSSSAAEASASENVQETTKEVTPPSEENYLIDEPIPQEVAEVKPLESTPIVTSPSEAPAMPKVKEVKVKVPKPLIDPIPQKTETKKIDREVKKTNIPIKDIKVTKPAAEPEKVPVKTSSSSGKSSSDQGKIGSGTSGKSKKTGSGQGSGDAGTGETNGSGKGDSGDGDDFFGSGFGSGSGDGVFDGDGILTRELIKRPNLSHLISETGIFTFNVCVNRSGKVTFVEFNEEHSTITDKSLVRKALAATNEYLFESKASAPKRECGRTSIKVKITK